jgi:hypothetical protein
VSHDYLSLPQELLDHALYKVKAQILVFQLFLRARHGVNSQSLILESQS